ncbi:N-acetyltransferase [Flavobacterium sediminis]|uniref:N-acetyltransferase n=1 Tax=Flavobacterium sediminis TaxID=2201181 RepID=A0A2U8QWN9_9FLAO|nr:MULTISPECIES: GNAT family N-acetyltransferase [Flavobacterium]AWM14469.1 N-acetyltransferase [Flavobacterium sediminis]
MKILETDRLILREFEPDDADFLFLLNQNSNVIRYTGDAPFLSVKEANDFIKNYLDYKIFGTGRWLVIEKEKNTSIGWCGLKNHDHEFIDLGFRFLEETWNKGYATEAAQACLDYGFNQLHFTEIIGRTMPENTASQRVLEKVGMQFSHQETVEGLHEALIYKISK